MIGFENRSHEPALADLDASPLNIFIIEDEEVRGPVLELFVDDLFFDYVPLCGLNSSQNAWEGCKAISNVCGNILSSAAGLSHE